MAASLSLFARYPLLRSLNNRSATQLAQHANVARWPVNGYLYRNGERPVMTYFLLRGRLGFETPSGLLSRSISAGDDAASKPLADVPHYRHSARCLTEVECLTVDTSLLDVMLNWGAEPPRSKSAKSDWIQPSMMATGCYGCCSGVGSTPCLRRCFSKCFIACSTCGIRPAPEWCARASPATHSS